MLCRFAFAAAAALVPGFLSPVLPGVTPVWALALLVGAALPAAFPFAVGLGGRSMTLSERFDALTNMPWFSSHSKYRSPSIEPSFFPVGPSSSIPAQTPGLNSVLPTNRMVPFLPSGSSTTQPGYTSFMVKHPGRCYLPKAGI